MPVKRTHSHSSLRTKEKVENSHPVIKNIDVALLGFPILFPILAGIGFGHIESLKNPVCKCIGVLGNRTCVVLTPLFGVPVVFYSVVKVIFGKLLVAATFGKISAVKKVSRFCQNQFKVVQCMNIAAALLLPQTKSVIDKAKR